MKLLSLVLMPFLIFVSVQAQVLEINFGGKKYLCEKQSNGKWYSGLTKRAVFSSYSKLVKKNNKLYKKKRKSKYLKLVKKYKKLHRKGLVACGDFCRDGITNPSRAEQCDDGNSINDDACTNSCNFNICRDGITGTTNGEECDDGNTINDDACNNSCQINFCGDGSAAINNGEECDDSNTVDNDTCTNACKINKVISLAAGGSHTCALLLTGSVRCWGDGYYGQLGYVNQNEIGDNETPASAGSVNVGGKVVQIVAGDNHSCALLDTGSVRCWGYGYHGQLGYGNTNNIGDDETPASAGDVNVGGNVVEIAAGNRHTCALLDTGSVRCWGDTSNGQLGYGNTNNIGNNETPASAGDVNVGGKAVKIVAGGFYTCAILDTGSLRCWGDGNNGQLGYGNTNDIGDNETPATTGNVNVGGSVAYLTAGLLHTCAVLDTGSIRCWGDGYDGQLGYGNQNDIGDNETPASAGDVNAGGNSMQIVAGGSHTCAILDTGSVRCWGEGLFGKLGYGNTNNIGDNETPASVGYVNIGGNVVYIDAGDRHTCAILDTGSVRCWGENSSGQLGYVSTDPIGDNETPASAGDVLILD